MQKNERKNQKFRQDVFVIFERRGGQGGGGFPLQAVFSSFRFGESWKNGACEGTQAVLAILPRKEPASFWQLEKQWDFSGECTNTEDIPFSKITTGSQKSHSKLRDF